MTRFINAKGLANIDAALPNEGALANAAGPGLKVTWWQRFSPHPGKAL